MTQTNSENLIAELQVFPTVKAFTRAELDAMNRTTPGPDDEADRDDCPPDIDDRLYEAAKDAKAENASD